jgi:hypothetical protein
MLDRRGLLSDILNAIATLPLEVKRAAITTSRDGEWRVLHKCHIIGSDRDFSQVLHGRQRPSTRCYTSVTSEAVTGHAVSHKCHTVDSDRASGVTQVSHCGQ